MSKKTVHNAAGLFGVYCRRCEAACKVAGQRNPDARMLCRSREAKGLCINCAVHDWLRNTYPVNMLLVESGPKSLLFPHIQEQFTGIMRIALADATPDEIDWERIVENWDLPFPHKMKPGPMNPCTQKELDEIASGKRHGLGHYTPPKPDPLDGKLVNDSFEDLNKLEPGLGDDFKRCLDKRKGGDADG